ncbi:MAG: BatD family protein [Bacteroidales bacterium]|nr:BatD family protein [Bacteroidales bacterium]
MKFLTIIIMLLSWNLKAQDVSFVASGPGRVAQGAQFRVSYTVNAQASNFKAPTFRDFNFLGGPNQSTSSNMQIINGQVSQTVQYSYTFHLQAVNVGVFEIGEASITVNGQTYRSNKLSVEVVAGNAPAARQQQPQQRQQNNQAQETQTIGAKDIFVRAIASKTNVYEGEEIAVLYKMYTAIPIAQYSINKIPSSRGFWTSELSDRRGQPKQYQEVFDGRNYTVAEIRKVYVYPQQSGNLQIEPLEMEILAQVRKAQQQRRGFWDSFFDDPFFGGGYTNVKKSISSNTVNIHVRKLPDNAPVEFSGAVGNFSVSASVDRQELPANEALKLQLTITGKGNLKLIDYPIIKFPNDFEVYDPKSIDHTKVTETGTSGSMVFEYVAIPRNKGNFKIESSKFVFFDPAKGNYVSLNIPEFEIKVSKGTGAGESVLTSVNQKELQYVGSDIRFLNKQNQTLTQNNPLFFGTFIYWILLILPILLFIVFILIYKKEIKRRSDLVSVRNKKAGKMARKRLSQAKKMLDSNAKNEFYEELSKAIWGYTADKLMISNSDLSTETVIDAVKATGLKEEIVCNLENLLNECEFARFAPANTENLMNSLYTKAYDLIILMDKEIK